MPKQQHIRSAPHDIAPRPVNALHPGFSNHAALTRFISSST
jgi:hypothetical protein